MSETGPFTITLGAVVVEGGSLKEPWVVAPQITGGKKFIALKKDNRKLAKALGLNVNHRSPMGNNDFFQQLAKLRDAVVDDFINKHYADDDPAADSQSQGSGALTPLHKPRQQLYFEANVPEIVEITYLEVIGEGGVKTPKTTLKVLSTPRRGGCVCVELTSENLEFMANAFHNHETEKHANDDDDDEEPIDEPNVKRRYLSNGSVALMCNWQSSDGKWHVHSKCPPRNPDGTHNYEMFAECATIVQKNYNSHHIDSDP